MSLRKIKLCQQKDCPDAATTEGYCRYHYLKNWKQIKEQRKKRAVKNLNRYIEHIVREHPKGYVDVIREDLRHPDQFSRKADGFSFDDDFHDVMEEVSPDDVTSVIKSIKVDESY